LKTITRILYVCLATVIVAGAVFVAGCTPEPITTTATITTTQTETITTTRTTTLLPEATIPFQIAEGITVTEANAMIQANIDNPEFVVIDVRTPDERAVSYIEGSILINFYDEDFATQLQALDRCTTYLLY
jgi:hypothetical protein